MGIFKEQQPEHSLKWVETMKTNRFEGNPTPVLPQCENSELKLVGGVFFPSFYIFASFRLETLISSR